MFKQNLNIIGLIPARKNSKGIKNKNIINFFGKPLISYSIILSKKNKLINQTFVSTDSKKIQKISFKYGAKCPFLRPSKISRDNSTDIEVFKHFYKFYKKKYKKKIDLLIHIRATTPLRSVSLVNKLINIMIKNKSYSSLRCFKPSSISPYKMWIKNKKVALKLINTKKEYHSMPRQFLPNVYSHIAYLDIIRPEKTIEKNSMVGSKVFFFEVDEKKYYTSDIDTKKDLAVEKKFQKKFLKFYK